MTGETNQSNSLAAAVEDIRKDPALSPFHPCPWGYNSGLSYPSFFFFFPFSPTDLGSSLDYRMEPPHELGEDEIVPVVLAPLGLQFRVLNTFFFSGYNFGLNCDTFGLPCTPTRWGRVSSRNLFSSGVYICKSVVNNLRHGNFRCKSEVIYQRPTRYHSPGVSPVCLPRLS